jgi:ATP-binding protein involved in chromosome partitioning
LGIPLLGRIPLDPLICDTGDLGAPVVLSHPETSAAEEFKAIAATVTELLIRGKGPAPIHIIN